MPKGQAVTKFCHNAMCVFGGVRLVPAMMKMNLDLAPPLVAMVSQHFEQTSVILFGWVKICVHQRPSVVVSPGIHDFRIFATPPFQAPLLLRTRNAGSTAFRIDGRLEMIGKRNH